MGKKRKALSQSYNNPDRHAKPDASSKLLINSYHDVADSEDEFLDNRDRVLLDEGPDTKRRRKIQEQDALLEASDEEVMQLPDSDDEDEFDEDEDEEAEELEDDDDQQEIDSEDEEVEGLKPARQGEEEDEDEGWGDAKQDYYGADAIDTEQSARDEEAEAKRLQQKQLEAMANTGMLFDIDEDEGEDEADDEDDIVIIEKLPDLDVPETLSADERLRLLRTRYPELEGIARDWLELHKLRAQVERDASHVPEIVKLRGALDPSGRTQTHVATMRYSALSAYLGACAMYFAVLTSPADGNTGMLALPPRKLRQHSVIQTLVESRQLWEQVRELPRVNTAQELDDMKRQVAKAERVAREAAVTQEETIVVFKPKAGAAKAKKSKADRAAEAASELSAARRAERMRKIEEDLADLSALTANTKTHTKKPTKSGKLIINEEDSDLGDESTLTAQELAAKAARKKSLKFYTSQIAQKANKQGARTRDYGGDLDVPHRERLRDREARLNAAAERRGRQALQPGEELGGESSDDDVDAKGNDRTANFEDDEGYYDMVAARSKQKKAAKKAAAEAYAEAKRQNAQVHEVEEVGPDGKRKISYQIEKNKGLTPHRKKEVRNPRVKKKLKYADKLKKLGSTKQVYKGGEGRGGYGGELSGIKTGLVKSVKL